MDKGKVDLRECRKGDVLISALGAKLEYVEPLPVDNYYDHKVKHVDGEYAGSFGTRIDDGHVFRYNRMPEYDHDIVQVIKKGS